MWPPHRILVPTDFSKSSRAACDVALELAQSLGVPIVLMHTFGLPASLYPELPIIPTADYVQSLEKAARVTLEREAQRLRGEGVEIAAVLNVGNAWESVLAVAKELGIGLIVMGTHGRRGLSRAVLGSVSEKVVRLSPVPVLTIHSPPEEESATAVV